MRLRKGYRIKTRGKEGIITGFSWKNSERVVEYETDEGTPYWAYRAHIEEVVK